VQRPGVALGFVWGVMLFALAHDAVVDGGEGGDGIGIKWLALLTRPRAQSLGVKQQFYHVGWPVCPVISCT
jgi:hypothetical protein